MIVYNQSHAYWCYLLIDLSGDGTTNQYETCEHGTLRRCGNCDNCLQASGRAAPDLMQETTERIGVAVAEALAEADVVTTSKFAEREQARVVRRRRRDKARTRRKQLASVAAVARS